MTQKTSPLSIERVVALLTPAFAAGAGWLSTIIAKAVPGLTIPKDQLVAVFVGGGVVAATAAVTWLRGRQKFTSAVADADKIADQVTAKVQGLPGAAGIEEILKAHTAAIVDAIGGAVHAPPRIEDIVNQTLARLGQMASSAGPASGAAPGPAASTTEGSGAP